MEKEKHTWKQIIGLDLTNILNPKLTWFDEQPPRLKDSETLGVAMNIVCKTTGRFYLFDPY